MKRIAAVGLAFGMAMAGFFLPLGRAVANVERAAKSSVKVLEGIAPLKWRAGKQCSYFGALEALLRYHGETYDYVDLMGISGAAFRIRLARSAIGEIMGGRIHPGISADGSFGNHPENVLESLGYRWRIDGHFMHENAKEGCRRVIEQIKGEIDAGRPLIALNLHHGSCWGVIAGYEEGVSWQDSDGNFTGEALFCRSYYDAPGANYAPAPGFPWDVWSITRAGDPVSEAELLRSSLVRAVDCLTSGKAQVNRGGWFWHYRPEYEKGISAYDAWITDLQDEDALSRLPKEQFISYWQGNAYMYDQLLDARRAAASYLKRIAERDKGDMGRFAGKAAGVFADQAKMMAENWDCFPYMEGGYVDPQIGWLLMVRQESYQGSLVPLYTSEWPKEIRRRAVKVLKSVRAKDEKALGYLKQATR